MARKIGSRYTVHQILGRGSAGTVWLGEGPEGPVAVKLFREDLASDEDLVERFVQERTALLGLDHPRIVGVRDLVVDGNDLALVMDLVRGTDLRTRLDRERRLAPEAAVTVAADIADALAVAHAAGVVHRDVKPENVLLDMAGPVGPGGAHPALLTDFGVARLVDSPARTRALRSAAGPGGGAGHTPRTAQPASARNVIGTPDYLAPEIVEGLPPRASVDIYALATVLYELLAGFTPFGGGHPGAVLRRHVTETVAPLPGIPDELWQLLVQCLAKSPASRLRAAELAGRLRELRPGLAGLPPLDVDDIDEGGDISGGAEGAAGAHGAGAEGGGASGGARAGRPDGGPTVPEQPRRGAVPLVYGSAPDSGRDTHTSMRVPSADELAGGAHGTARVPRRPGEPRPGSARRRSEAVRRRRIRLGITAAALLLAAGLGGWLAATADGATPVADRTGGPSVTGGAGAGGVPGAPASPADAPDGPRRGEAPAPERP
ncbi:serine/threonine-protein kinase [Streptomyces zingiberis]|uniref:non-specific serine/threonine protein kinase n=1 Tax=Streptomyces zingiberis TaxID=2053010 RepID=A0ABX1BZL9_9ACTN|nr:serine/threonine-protein kinase [Streptomyces zingiberis]NJQ01773.1 serine/threonine protein kinase [Streptomyces zingiberis]